MMVFERRFQDYFNYIVAGRAPIYALPKFLLSNLYSVFHSKPLGAFLNYRRRSNDHQRERERERERERGGGNHVTMTVIINPQKENCPVRDRTSAPMFSSLYANC